jgi:hypothetical protein
VNEREQKRQHAPRQHDSREPPARAEAAQCEIALHFEQYIAEEEDARTGAGDGRRKAELLVHRECGEAQVDAIQISREITQQHQQRQNVPANFCDRVSLIDGILGLLVFVSFRGLDGGRAVSLRANRITGSRLPM